LYVCINSAFKKMFNKVLKRTNESKIRRVIDVQYKRYIFCRVKLTFFLIRIKNGEQKIYLT